MRSQIEAAGTRLAVVHMGNVAQGMELLGGYGLSDLPQVSDPEAALYREFGLSRGRLAQVMGLKVWLRGAQSFLLGGHKVGRPIGDPLQMPGVFLIHRGRIVRGYYHETSADRPDYAAMAACELPNQ
ncbi:MAG: hypothetical protein SF339_15140 [Blastocatellia bacterium]|nr:hypothetical protein [Blastocatellia bacterium]